MQKAKKVQNFKEGGITLIALVITIIVLLILAGVALNALTGDSGILTNAEKAKKDTEQSNLEEEVGLKLMEHKLDGGELKEDLQKISGVGTDGVTTIRDNTYKVVKGQGTVVVYEDGEIYTGEIWDGESTEAPKFDEKGNWYIYNASQLKFFADTVNNTGSQLTDEQKKLIKKAGYDYSSDLEIDNDTIVYLMADIELGGNATVSSTDGSLSNITNEWDPIGNMPNNKFTGTFEGNNHYISGVYVAETGSVTAGLFGAADTIRNLTIRNSYIYSAKQNVGGIAGAVIEGEIVNCHNVNTQIVGKTINVGGIVGYFTGTKIEKCTNSGNVDGGVSNSGGQSQAGGIVGMCTNTDKKVIITDCKNTGEVTGAGKLVGGIVGVSEGGDITNCSNSAKLVEGEVNVGGIIGTMLGTTGTIQNCTNTGNITATNNTGGGIAGVTETCKIDKCYNSGKVNATFNVAGGIVGYTAEEKGTTITNCYSKGTITARDNSGALIGLEMSKEKNTINNLYYLAREGTGAIDGVDVEGKAVSTTRNFNSLQEFLKWLQNQ